MAIRMKMVAKHLKIKSPVATWEADHSPTKLVAIEKAMRKQIVGIGYRYCCHLWQGLQEGGELRH